MIGKNKVAELTDCQPLSIDINAYKLAVPPSVVEMTKKDITRLGIEAALTISFSLPEVCKPTIPGVKVKPTLYNKRNGART